MACDFLDLTKKLSGPPSEAREARRAAELPELIYRAGPGPLKRLVRNNDHNNSFNFGTTIPSANAYASSFLIAEKKLSAGILERLLLK